MDTKKFIVEKKIIDKNYPQYKDVINVLKTLDKKIDSDIYHKYLGDKTGVSTKGEWVKGEDSNYHQIWVWEIIVRIYHIPVQ